MAKKNDRKEYNKLKKKKADNKKQQEQCQSEIDVLDEKIERLKAAYRKLDDANAPVCAAGATTPEPDPGVEGREEGLDLPGGQIGVRLLCGEVGVCWGREEWSGSARRADRREIVVCGRGECVGGRGEGLDSPGGRIGVSLLTGAKFGDRMKKNIFGVFCA